MEAQQSVTKRALLCRPYCLSIGNHWVANLKWVPVNNFRFTVERTGPHTFAGKTLPHDCKGHIQSIEHLRILSDSWYAMQHYWNTDLHSACVPCLAYYSCGERTESLIYFHFMFMTCKCEEICLLCVICIHFLGVSKINSAFIKERSGSVLCCIT